MTIGRDSFRALYSQLSPCEHPTITHTDTPIILTAAKSYEKLSYAIEDTNSRSLECPL